MCIPLDYPASPPVGISSYSLISHDAVSHHFLQARQLQYSVPRYSSSIFPPAGAIRYDRASIKIAYTMVICIYQRFQLLMSCLSSSLQDDNFSLEFSGTNLSASVPENLGDTFKCPRKRFAFSSDEEALRTELSIPLARDQRKLKKQHTNQRNTFLGMCFTKPSSLGIGKPKDYSAKPNRSPITKDSAAENTTYYPKAEVVKNRIFVSDKCRKALEIFMFRPQPANPALKPEHESVMGVGGEDKHTISAWDGNKIQAGNTSEAGPAGIAQMNCHSAKVDEGSLVELLTSMGDGILDEKQKNLMEGDSEISEYGSNSGLYKSFPILDTE